MPKSWSHYIISLKNNKHIHTIAAFPKEKNKGIFLFISCQVLYFTDWRVKNVNEQQRLRRGIIINNMLTVDKSTAQGLQARPGASLYFSVCEQVGKHSLYLKRVTEWGGRRGLHTNFLFISILPNTHPHTNAQIHLPPHIRFFKVFKAIFRFAIAS